MKKNILPKTNYSPPTIRVNILFTLLLLSTSNTSSEEVKNSTIKNINIGDSTTDKKIDSNDSERINNLIRMQSLKDNINFDPQISTDKIKKIHYSNGNYFMKPKINIFTLTNMKYGAIPTN